MNAPFGENMFLREALENETGQQVRAVCVIVACSWHAHLSVRVRGWVGGVLCWQRVPMGTICVLVLICVCVPVLGPFPSVLVQ